MSVRELHDKAMAFAETAMLEKRKGNDGYAQQLYHQAYTCEASAAQLLSPVGASEPTRGILYRSASWLAFNAGDYHMAQHLAATGLSGQPVPDIRVELQQALEAAIDRLT